MRRCAMKESSSDDPPFKLHLTSESSRAPAAVSSATSSRIHAEPRPAVPPPSRRSLWRSSLGSDPQLPKLAVEMLDVRGAKRLQADVLYRLQQTDQPRAQLHRQGLDLGFDGSNSLNRPAHTELYSVPAILFKRGWPSPPADSAHVRLSAQDVDYAAQAHLSLLIRTRA